MDNNNINLESSQAYATRNNEYPDYHWKERFICDGCSREFEEHEFKTYKDTSLCNDCFNKAEVRDNNKED